MIEKPSYQAREEHSQRAEERVLCILENLHCKCQNTEQDKEDCDLDAAVTLCWTEVSLHEIVAIFLYSHIHSPNHLSYPRPSSVIFHTRRALSTQPGESGAFIGVLDSLAHLSRRLRLENNTFQWDRTA
mmetsp:Transcript_27305/g.58474  ORF Transcript_27305/g.58474 Transcript_27305/m.58474 type:complete len:129 (+) Transcript_27305:86-472(+)